MQLKAALLCVIGISVAGSGVEAADVTAFPDAAGFGAMTKGGRGGRVLFVTNLDDYRPGREKPIAGSLRVACEAGVARTVVFQISGTIDLKSPLTITEPFITIAGQSAPGDGICLKNYGLSVRHTHDVVIRHLRVRPGDRTGKELDGLSVYQSRNVIVDHCSVGWSIDEALSVTGDGCTDVTIQWCLISESLNDSAHSKGPHGYGSLIRANGNITFHHNIYAHHASRCPRPGTYGDGSLLLDFRNNIVYDGNGYSGEDPVRMNYVGNYIKRPRNYAFRVGGNATKIFAAGNVQDGQPELDDWEFIVRAKPQNKVDQPYRAAVVTTQTAEQAYGRLLDSCGATLPKRDAVDARVIKQVRSGTGQLIDSQSEVGGWPTLRSTDPPVDTDHDGMPDEWERTNGLNPNDPSDGHRDHNDDGYSNVEVFLNHIPAS